MEEESIDPRVEFGRRVREVRQQRGVSQERLAVLAGVDRTYLSRCERGRQNISLVNIYRIARALGVRPSELLEEPRT